MNRLQIVLIAILFVLPSSRLWGDNLERGKASITICNRGGILVELATAFQHGDSKWSIDRWKRVPSGACNEVLKWYMEPLSTYGLLNVFSAKAQPVLVALAFTDSTGVWGAGKLKLTTGFFGGKWNEAQVCCGDDGDSVKESSRQLCVDRGSRQYTTRGADPAATCKDEPGTLLIIPAAIEYAPKFDSAVTIDVKFGPGDRAIPLGPPSSTSGATQGAETKSAGSGSGDISPLGALALGLGAVFIAKELGDSPGAPKPFEEGTLNAQLLGKRIVRRASGNADWYYEDGSRVNPVYRLEGQTNSYLLDAPTQRATADPEVIAAHQGLQRALDSWSWTRRTEILPQGRLFYSYAEQREVVHQVLVNIATLDFARARRINQQDGLNGFELPCREDKACAISLDKDSAGALSNNHIQANFEFYFVGDGNGEAAWKALLKLRDLFPAEPAVVAQGPGAQPTTAPRPASPAAAPKPVAGPRPAVPPVDDPLGRDGGFITPPKPSAREADVCLPPELVDKLSWDHPAPGSKMAAFQTYLQSFLRDYGDGRSLYRITDDGFDRFGRGRPDPSTIFLVVPAGQRCPASNYVYTVTIPARR